MTGARGIDRDVLTRIAEAALDTASTPGAPPRDPVEACRQAGVVSAAPERVAPRAATGADATGNSDRGRCSRLVTVGREASYPVPSRRSRGALDFGIASSVYASQPTALRTCPAE